MKTLLRIVLSYLLILNLTPAFGQGRVSGEVQLSRGFDLGTGVIFFVDDSGADESGVNGTIPRPFATIDYAIGKCGTSPAAASTGCTIFVMEGHAEVLSTDDAVNIDVAGISIIGLGRGGLRPSLSFTGTTANFSIEAANVEIANLEFVANVANHVNFVDIQATGDGAYIHDNLFREGSQTGIGMVDFTGIADDVVIDNNTFYAPTAGNYNAAILMTSSTSTRGTITNNTIQGDFDDAGIHNPTSNVSTLFNISNNIVTNSLTGAHAIEIVSAVTGVLSGNRLQSDLIATSLDPGSLMATDNLWVSAINGQGVPIPEAAQYFPNLGYRVRAAAVDHSADTDLWSITGMVLVTLIVGEVTTNLSASHTVDLETDGNVALAAQTTVDSDGDGTLYMSSGDFGVVLNGADVPTLEAAGVASAGNNSFIIGGDGETVVIRLDFSASETGNSLWTIFYMPISAGATVVAS